MKKFFIIILFLLILQGNLNAQSVSSAFITISAGTSFPVIEKDFSRTYTLGPALTGGFGFILNKNIIIKAEASYNHFYLQNNLNISGLDIISYNVRLIFSKFNSSILTPFAAAGMGAYTLSDYSSSLTNIGFNFGFGISGSYKNNIIPYGEIRLDYNLTSGTAKGFIPISAGVIFRF